MTPFSFLHASGLALPPPHDFLDNPNPPTTVKQVHSTSHNTTQPQKQKNTSKISKMLSIYCRRARRRASTLPVQLGIAATFLLILSIVASTRVVVEASPLSIGIRTAIARGPIGFGASNLPRLSSHRRTLAGRLGDKSDVIPSNDEDDLSREELLTDKVRRGGGTVAVARRLHFWEAMICGAVSRSAAQTIMHPANTMKTILQSSRKIPGQKPLTVLSFTQWKYAKTLTRGAGAQLILSIPHGAVNFAVLELVRRQMNSVVSRSRHADTMKNFGPVFDFLSSAMSTICCSVVSTPQMMICDNIMAGTYPNLLAASKSLMKDKGIAGFYVGWWPGIAGKIPSYVRFSVPCYLFAFYPRYSS